MDAGSKPICGDGELRFMREISMKKINSIHYGGRVLVVGGIITVVIPALCWLLSIWLNKSILLLIRNCFFILGFLIIAGFFPHKP